MFDFAWIGEYYDLILRGIAMTVLLTLIGGFLGVSIGVSCNRLFVSAGPLIRAPIVFSVDFLRNTPFLIQLFFVFFGLPSAGIKLSPFQAALTAVTLSIAAYSVEIIRAGVDATPRGQVEAGHALGMSRGEVFWYVQINPAFTRVWPALCSQLVLVMLGSAVVSQVSVEDLSYAANFIQSRNFRAFETYFVLTVVYLCIAAALRSLLNFIGRICFPRGNGL